MNVDLAAREEGLDAEHINDHAALGAALDVALDDFVVLQCLVDVLPALLQACLLVGENELSALVLLVLHVDFNLVAYLEVRVVTELGSGDDAVALVADVDDYFLLVDGDDGAFHHLVFLDLVERLVVCLGEVALVGLVPGTVLELVPVEVS